MPKKPTKPAMKPPARAPMVSLKELCGDPQRGIKGKNPADPRCGTKQPAPPPAGKEPWYKKKRYKLPTYAWLIIILVGAPLAFVGLYYAGVFGSTLGVARPYHGTGYAQIVFLDQVTGEQIDGVQAQIYDYDNETYVSTIEQNVTTHFTRDSMAVPYFPNDTGQMYFNQTVGIEAHDDINDPLVNFVTLKRKTPTSALIPTFVQINGSSGKNASDMVADTTYLITVHMNNTLWSSNESTWGSNYVLPNSTFTGYQATEQIYRHGGWVAFDQNVTINYDTCEECYKFSEVSRNITMSLWVVPLFSMPIDAPQEMGLLITTGSVAPQHIYLYQGSIMDYAEMVEITLP